LIDEVAEVVSSVGGFSKAIRLSYTSVFEQYLEIDIFTCSDHQLKLIGLDKISSLAADIELDRDGWLELLMSEVIEPKLAAFDRPVIIYDFPVSQAQLAKIHIDEQGREVAARFELYAGGLELANGYDELLDADELRHRFEQDNQQRLALDKAAMPFDEYLLAAMTSGLPQCVGIALGLDRLLMAMLNGDNINQVLFKLD
jgi:lysyl-tRNA synthetase class 2